MREKPALFIVEDDEGIRELYEGALSDYDITLFENGNDFFNVFKKEKPDLIILDIMLPDMDGYSILSQIRLSDEKVPVIIVSAKSDELSSVKGLNKGADDYITKPFSFKEAVMRVNAQLRRYYHLNTAENSGVRRLNELAVYPEKFEARVMNEPLKLTAKEFKMLDVLTANPDRIFSKSQLIDRVWGEDEYIDENTVAVTVLRLREKLEAKGIKNVVTVWGLGYKWQS